MSYHESVTEPWTAWLLVAGFAVALGVVVLPVDALAALAVIPISAAALTWALLRWRLKITVADGALSVGTARVPVALLAGVTILDEAGMRHARGPGLDARAFLALRPGVVTGARIELADPGDPTPYWLVSTRHPQELAYAVLDARDGGQG